MVYEGAAARRSAASGAAEIGLKSTGFEAPIAPEHRAPHGLRPQQRVLKGQVKMNIRERKVRSSAGRARRRIR
jgi:hypothetical protein